MDCEKKIKVGDLIKLKLLENGHGKVVKVVGRKWLKVQYGNIILLEHIDGISLKEKR